MGNLLLGQEEFVTRERTSCSRRVGAVSGRWLTVVDTPGWWCDFSSRDTPELVKREIRSSVSLCPPGPHAVLITVKASSGFSERRRRAVEEHVALLGEGVWDHCMVVLTATPAGPEEERGRARLRWLIRKCGHRWHAVGSGGAAEAARLLEKIQELVTQNGNRALETPPGVLEALLEEKRRVEEAAQQRFLTVKKHRSLARGERTPPPPMKHDFLVALSGLSYLGFGGKAPAAGEGSSLLCSSFQKSCVPSPTSGSCCWERKVPGRAPP